MNEDGLDFVARYVSLWNEPDRVARRKAIEELWAPDGANYTPSAQAIGYDALEARVTSSYDTYIAPGKYYFRSHLPPAGHHSALKVTWAMVTIPQEKVASIGVEFLQLDDQGRITSDHQFIIA